MKHNKSNIELIKEAADKEDMSLLDEGLKRILTSLALFKLSKMFGINFNLLTAKDKKDVAIELMLNRDVKKDTVLKLFLRNFLKGAVK